MSSIDRIDFISLWANYHIKKSRTFSKFAGYIPAPILSFKTRSSHGMSKSSAPRGSVLLRVFGISWPPCANLTSIVKSIIGWDRSKGDCTFLRLYFSGIGSSTRIVGCSSLNRWKSPSWELGCEVFPCSKMDFSSWTPVTSIWLLLFVNFLSNCSGYKGSAPSSPSTVTSVMVT